MDDEACTKMAMRIIVLAAERFNIHLDLRTIENLLCKCYRTVCPSAREEQWKDLQMSRQPIIINKNDKWMVVVEGGENVLGDGPLVEGIPFARRVVNTRKFVLELDIPGKKLPSGPTVHKWNVPRAVMFNEEGASAMSRVPEHADTRVMGQDVRLCMEATHEWLARETGQILPRPNRGGRRQGGARRY